MHLQPVLY